MNLVHGMTGGDGVVNLQLNQSAADYDQVEGSQPNNNTMSANYSPT